MDFLRKLISIMLIMCFVFLLCACEGSGDARIYFSVENMPETLDPQVASSDSELLICRNIYEGLFRKKGKDEIIPAAVEDYDYSGLVYTFKLRDNLKWADGQPLTADDFVFGIKRALLPETRAPFARLLYAIAGAAELNSGASVVTPATSSSLGISAPDDKTIIITLSYDDKNFLNVLSMPIAMPCREDFFADSTGKYGLEKDCVLSCGSYYLARWNKENAGIRLYKNDDYTGQFRPKNGGVFISCDKEKTVSEKLLSEESDIALISSVYLPEISDKENIKTVSVQNICWVLSLGGDFNENIRRALCGCISRDSYGKILPLGFSAANSIFPECLGDINAFYDLNYDPDGARAIIAEEISGFKNKKFPQTTLIFTECEMLRPVITEIVGDWQKNLSTFINIKPTDKPLESELKEHTMPLALFPVKADSTVDEYLYKFGDSYFNGYRLVPIAYENTTVAYLGNLSGVNMNATGGYIDFSGIIKN